MNGPGPLRFAIGEFYGGVRLACASHGISVTHRIADRAPEEVLEHTHSDAHFVLITGGDYLTVATGRPEPGFPVFVFNPPGTTHRDRFEQGRGSYFAISIEPVKAALLLEGIPMVNEPSHLTALSQYSIALRMARCCSSPQSGLALESLCHELLGSLDRRAQHDGRAPPSWLSRAMELLRDRYLENLSIADVAAGIGVHPIHLARSFRRHCGCSPAEFTRFRRVEKAAQILTRSGKPLSEIALSCGFADQSHFTRDFSRSLGISPGRYREVAGRRPAPAKRFQNDKRSISSIGKSHTWNLANQCLGQ
jgi:AraC family transcriptional regulator